MVPSVVEFDMLPSEATRCHTIHDLISREHDPHIRDQLLRSAADIEARVLVETEPLLDLDPSPEVEKRATLENYNKSKYKVPRRDLHVMEGEASATALGSSGRFVVTTGGKDGSLTEKAIRGISSVHDDIGRLMLVSETTTSQNRDNGDGAGSAGSAGASGGATGSANTQRRFQPRFGRLEYIEEYRKRKRSFDNETMLGLDARRMKQKTDRRAPSSMDPEYLALNGAKVVRTVRFEQALKEGVIYTILNIIETGIPDEYEAILRIGNSEGNAVGPYSGTLRYPVGNMLAVDNYLGYFKSFYGLTNKMTGVLVTVNNSTQGSMGPSSILAAGSGGGMNGMQGSA
ncbi:hypothetical protein BC830DRAFT_411648 [Chytriomyces sp. MP71]|nr:hypothetical protein BC830DRAFT_411648 [Chytriomyces sp. MP71]